MPFEKLTFAKVSDFLTPTGNLNNTGIADELLARFEACTLPFESPGDIESVKNILCGQYRAEGVTPYFARIKEAMLSHHLRSAEILVVHMGADDVGTSYRVTYIAQQILAHGQHAQKLGHPSDRDCLFDPEKIKEMTGRAHHRSAQAHLAAFERNSIIYQEDPVSGPRVARIIAAEIMQQFEMAQELTVSATYNKDEVTCRADAVIARIIESHNPPKEIPANFAMQVSDGDADEDVLRPENKLRVQEIRAASALITDEGIFERNQRLMTGKPWSAKPEPA